MPTVSGRKPRKPTEVEVLGTATENRPADCDRQPHIISATNVSKHATEQVRFVVILDPPTAWRNKPSHSLFQWNSTRCLIDGK